MAKKTIEDIQVNGKKVLVRCDFNVPMDENKVITDENRLRGALPTIQYLIKNGAKVILCSHLGRPKGEFNMKYSLRPVAERLSQLLGQEVKMADDVIGESAHKLASELKDGEVTLLENVRFHKEEEKNDPEFAKELASLAEVYVNDAFGTAHRAQCFHRGRGPSAASRRGRLPDWQGTEHHGQGAGRPGSSLCGGFGRREGVRQDRCYQQPAG